MRRKFILFGFCIVSAMLIMQGIYNNAHSYGTGAPSGVTGSPADGSSCVTCHTPPGTPFSGSGVITSNIPSTGYTASQTYTIRASVTRPGHTVFGFEVSPQDTTSAGNRQGTIIITDTSRTQLASGVQDYITHTAAGNAGTADSNVWTFHWTAPATGHGPVVFYGAFNVTNDNGRPTGDSIFLTSMKVYECAAPTAPASISGAATVCPGSTSTYSVAAGGVGTTFIWSLPTGWTGSSTTNSISATAGSTGGNITVKAVNTCGSSGTTTKAVTVSGATATITPSGPTTFCQGGNVTLTASVNASYKWSSGQTTQAITVSSSGSFTVSVTAAGGCTAVSSATVVTVNPLPVATISASGPTTFCQGGSVTLTASPNTAYTWNRGQTTQAITVASSATYSVTVTNANNCTAASSGTTVTVLATPVATITASGPTTFCQGGSVTLTASTNASYKWSNNQTTQAIIATSTANYVVTVTGADGCTAISPGVPVTVNAAPIDTISAGGPTTFCKGGSVTLTASVNNSYHWSSGQTTRAIAAITTGNYVVTATNTASCTAASNATVVTVNPLPTATITAGGPTSFCQGGSVLLTASTNTSYKWSNGQTTQAVTDSTSGSYVVTVTNAKGCSAASSATVVTVNPLPTATITASGALKFCKGDSVILTAAANASYVWSTSQTTQSITAKATGSYAVTVTSAGGCSAVSTPTAVTAEALPKAVVTASGPITFCKGDSVILSATVARGDKYLWSTNATTEAITVKTAGRYTVTVTNANMCSAKSKTTTVKISCTALDNTQADKADGDDEGKSIATEQLPIPEFKLSVYPNPYNTGFHLKILSTLSDNIEIKVFDIGGRLVEEKLNVPYGTDLILGSNYAGGFYFVQIRQGEISRQVPVIKMDN